MRKSPWLALAVLTCACASASGTEPAPEDLGAVSEPILGGYNDDADTAVMAIIDVTRHALCSGALIAPNVVLTARHCVSTLSGGEYIDCADTTFGPVGAASSFFATTNATVDQAHSAELAVDEILGVSASGDKLCGSDLALLVLHESVPAAKARPYLPRVDSAPAPNEAYHAIGFGATDGGGSAAGRRRRRDGLAVSCVDASCATEITAGEWAGGGATCLGDSGGPALDAQGRIIGVTSRGGTSCESSVYSGVVRQWLADSVIYAAKKGGYAAPEWTAGPIAVLPAATASPGGATSEPNGSSGAQRPASSGGCAVSCGGSSGDRGGLGVVVAAALALILSRRR